MCTALWVPCWLPQRNARRLDFIEEDDTIQRLQLAYGDGSNPEELDVDATLGDVIICMSDKQLIAIVNSTKGSPTSGNPPTSANDAAHLLGSDVGIVHHSKRKNKSINTAPPSGYDGTIDRRMATERKFRFRRYKPPANRVAPKEPAMCNIEPSPSRLPPGTDPGAATLSFHHDNVDRGCAGFPSDYRSSSSLPPLGPSRSSVGNVVTGASNQGRHSHGLARSSLGGSCPSGTPSLAELASMLVRSSSSDPPDQNMVQCPHGTSTNITLLAQFLAWQLRAFAVVESSAHPSDPSLLSCRENKSAATVSAKDPMNVSSGGAVHNPPSCVSHGRVAMPETENVNSPSNVVENGCSGPKNDNNVKISVSGSHEKVGESSSSADVFTATGNVPTGDVANGRNELVFLVNRRSKAVRFVVTPASPFRVH